MRQERLKELFHYDPDTGIFTRLIPISQTKAGDIAGCKSTKGYLRIRVSGSLYLSHRLAFLYMTGEFPRNHTDHINGIKNDNRWSNLRSVTSSGNGKNTKIPSDNKSGIMGVHWDKGRARWVAFINLEGSRKHLSRFSDFFEACCARKSAEIKYEYHENHGRR